MKTNLLRYLRGNLPSGRAKLNKRISVFLSCLALAALFWLLNALSKNYYTTIEFPVVYDNFPDEHIVVNELPDHIVLGVNGYGYSLLGHYLEWDKDELRLDISELSSRNGASGRMIRFLPTERIKNGVDSQLGNELSVQRVFPDSIRVILENKKSVMVPVKLSSRISFAPQYQLYDEIEIKPSAVNVTGPSSYIDTLTKVSTDSLIHEELDENKTTTVGFSIPGGIKGVEVSPEQVIVTVPVDKYTEASETVGVDAVNFPDSLIVRTFPRQVEVIYMVPLSRYEQVSVRELKAVVDYEDIGGEGENRLKVRLVKHPEYIKVKRLKPQYVEYILKQQ